MGNFHTAVLCEFIAKFNFISKPFNYNIHFLEVVSIVVNTFLQSLVEILHHSLQNDWRNCCHFIPNVLFQVLCCPLSLFNTLLLKYPQRKKSQVLRMGGLADHSTFPLCDMWAGKISLRAHIAFFAVWAVAPSCWNHTVWISVQNLCNSSSRNVQCISI
jgi:hypothetical protein